MQNRTRTLLRLALAGTSLLTLATMASAQDQAASADSGTTVLEEVVVNGGSGGVITADGYVGKSSATGAKTDTPFVQTPQSISSVTKDQRKTAIRKPCSKRSPIHRAPASAATASTRVSTASRCAAST